MLSQNDPAWKLKKINGTTSTIGSYGCLITSICFILQKAGYNVTPDVLAKQSDLFNGDMWAGWDKLHDLYPNINYIWGEKCSSYPAPIDKIISEVKDGYYPIIMLDYAPKVDGTQTHYLVVTDADSNGNLKVGDPWDGAEIWLDTRYGELDEKYKILKVDVYHFTKPPITDDKWENIKKYLEEQNADEGKVREAFGALSDINNYQKTISDLQSALSSKQITISQKDGIISDLTTKIDGLTAQLTAKNGYRERLATILDCEADWDAIVGEVTEAIGNEDKYAGLLIEHKILQGEFEERVAKEVDTKNFDITLKLTKANSEIEGLRTLNNSLQKKVDDLKSIINGTKISWVKSIINWFLSLKK